MRRLVNGGDGGFGSLRWSSEVAPVHWNSWTALLWRIRAWRHHAICSPPEPAGLAARRGCASEPEPAIPFTVTGSRQPQLALSRNGTNPPTSCVAWRGPSGLSSTLQINRYSIRPCHWQTAHTYQSMHKSVRGLDPESALVVSQSEVAGRLPEKVVRWDCSGPSTLRPRVTDSGPR